MNIEKLQPETFKGFLLKKNLLIKELEKAHYNGNEENVVKYEKELENIEKIMEEMRLKKIKYREKEDKTFKEKVDKLDWING